MIGDLVTGRVFAVRRIVAKIVGVLSVDSEYNTVHEWNYIFNVCIISDISFLTSAIF